MDDCSCLSIPLLSQMFHTSRNHPANEQTPPISKRELAPCQNWNAGICLDPCIGRHKHGICCECGGEHRVKDQQMCFSHLQARQGKRVGRNDPTSGMGGGKT